MSLSEISTEWEVFAAEGHIGVGGVRAVRPDHLLVHIEGFGEIALRAEQIKAAHNGKIILELSALPKDVQDAVAHAHYGETE